MICTCVCPGNLPKKGKLSPPFTLVKKDLSQTGLGDYPHEVRADAEADNGHFDGETTE